MKIEPISVHGSYEYMNEFGLKRWKKISIGATVTEEEDVIACIKELDEKVEEAYKKISQTLSIVADNTPVPEVQVEKIIQDNDLEDINSCEDLEVLKSFKMYTLGKPVLEAAYFVKLAQLTKKQK